MKCPDLNIFLPRDAMRQRGLCYRPSVRPSVTLVDCIRRLKISSNWDQMLWLILTHDGSKCAESRKDVLFGVKIFNVVYVGCWPANDYENY